MFKKVVQKFLMRNQTGVMSIPNSQKVDFAEAVIKDNLIRNGINPDSIPNEKVLESILGMIEKSKKKQTTSGIRSTSQAKVFDMEGKEINPRSKLMGGKQAETEAEILSRIERENQEAIERIRQRRDMEDPEDMAQGGIARLGFKDGMSRRTFMKILGGAMAIPIIGKFLKPMKIGKKMTNVPMIKTDNVAGKPEWFDQLVNKVILEGDDVTKRFATGERQSIYQKRLDDGSTVRVTQDMDEGAVRVEYESDKNVFEDPVQMQYKKPLPDEGAPSPTAEFDVAESGPVGRQTGPDDYDIDVDEVGGTSIRDLDSDVSKLKEYATGKKPTMQELVQNIKRREKAAKITEGGDEMIDAVTRRQGD